MIARVMEGQEIVCHLAAQNILGAACEAGVKRVIFSSSLEVYGDVDGLSVRETAPRPPKNAYGFRAFIKHMAFEVRRAPAK